MKKLLTEWRKYLKEFDYDVEASVDRDADFGKHADFKMKIENALDEKKVSITIYKFVC